jgi:hypothetical protein
MLPVMLNQSIASVYRGKRKPHGNRPILNMSVSGVSMISGLVSNFIGK